MPDLWLEFKKNPIIIMDVCIALRLVRKGVRHTEYYFLLARLSAARIVFVRSIAIVIGPTPPGTGVI
jgi:fumarate reductase subunit C